MAKGLGENGSSNTETRFNFEFVVTICQPLTLVSPRGARQRWLLPINGENEELSA
jgi:hypothetical protein